jgi:hypothetical protein
MRGRSRQIQSLLRRKHALAESEAGQGCGKTSGSQNSLLKAQPLGSRLALDFDLARAEQVALALQVGNAVLLEQLQGAFGELLHDSVLPLLNFGEIQADFVSFNADLAGSLNPAVEVADLDQSLGGNAAAMQAFSAGKKVLRNDGHFLAQLGEPDRRDVASGAAANHDVIDGFGQFADDHLGFSVVQQQ